MAKTNTYENELLQHIFQNAAISGVGDATGLPAAATAGQLFVSLHTADPGEAGTQTTSEAAYTGYARVGVARSGSGWVVTGNSVSPAATITFGEWTGGATTPITHWGVGTASSGAGKLLYRGSITPTITPGTGITPRLNTSTAVTEE